MADNFSTPVADATTLATKDISGVHYPKNLIAKWDGTDADLATQTTVAAINSKLNASIAVTQSGAWTVGVSGSVAVTGTFWQATQPVSIAAAVAVTQSGSWWLTANQTVDVNRIAGTATAVNTGNASAGTQRVVLATDQPSPTNPWRTLNIVQPSKATFTRPSDTTAYAVGDLIANSTTAGSVTRMSFAGAGSMGRITEVILTKSGTAAARVRAHFLKTDHAVTNGDNGALVFTSLDPDDYIGFMDVSFTGTDDGVGSGGNLIAKSYDAPLNYTSGSGTIYCVLESLTAWTPANGGTFGARPTFEVLN